MLEYLFSKVMNEFSIVIVRYFNREWRNEMPKKMCASVRTECGLGDPPQEYSTNGNESKHAQIKDYFDYKETNLYSCAKKISEIVLSEQKDIIMGRMGIGQYHLKQEFR